jgi:hypothetical protein
MKSQNPDVLYAGWHIDGVFWRHYWVRGEYPKTDYPSEWIEVVW